MSLNDAKRPEVRNPGMNPHTIDLKIGTHNISLNTCLFISNFFIYRALVR